MARKSKWRLAAGLVVVAALALLHAPLLRRAAAMLVADAPAGDFDAVCLSAWHHAVEDDRPYKLAAEMCRKNPSAKVLLADAPPGRLAETRTLPSFESVSRRELTRLGVPAQSIVAVHSDGMSQSAIARALGAWLREHPRISVLWVRLPLRSGHARRVLDRVLEPAEAARVGVRVLPGARCNESNWWKSRGGVREFAAAWLLRLQDWAGGAAAVEPSPLSAREYERRFWHALEDAGPLPPQAKYVMVLTGEEASRPFAAATLYKRHRAKQAVVAQAAVSLPEESGLMPRAAELDRHVLLARGVPEDNVHILDGAAASTRDEALALAAFLQDEPEARVLVVTSGYHARRARWIFDRVFGDRAGVITFVSAPSDEFEMKRWRQDEWGLVLVAMEYLKFAFYVVCYGHFIAWLAACAALAVVLKWARRRQPAS